MTLSRTAHAISAIAAGAALAASIYGAPRVAIALLALTVLINCGSLEALRALAASSEKRP